MKNKTYVKVGAAILALLLFLGAVAVTIAYALR